MPQQAVLRKPFGLKFNVDEQMGIECSDLHLKMKLDERRHRAYCPEARYLRFRRLLVDWMCEVGDELRLHNSTMHVAVLFLDRMLQSVTVAKSRLQLVAISCILIAAKLEEAEEHVPAVMDLNEFAQPGYSPDEIQGMEMQVLNQLGWSMGAVTPLHFLGYYLSKGVVFEDDTFQGRPLVDKVPRYVQKYAEFFADLCLQDYAFQRYEPSLLAAAIITASRKALHIAGAPGAEAGANGSRGLWRPELTALTGTSELAMAPVMDHLWKHYLRCFPTAWSAPAAEQGQDKKQVSPTGAQDFPEGGRLSQQSQASDPGAAYAEYQ